MENITHLTCDGNVTTIYTVENRTSNISKPLKYFETELSEKGFVRANHNTIVNCKNIMDYIKGHYNTIILTNNVKIKISRRKVHLFKDFFNN